MAKKKTAGKAHGDEPDKPDETDVGKDDAGPGGEADGCDETKEQLVAAGQAHAAALGWNWEDVKAGARRFLPLAELFAQSTQNRVDDAFLAFVRTYLGD